MVAPKNSVFSPAKLSAEQKASSTHETAMRIIDAEAAAREKKTERLRRLREEHQTANPPTAPKPRQSRTKKS